MGCGSSSENDRNATNLGDPNNNYRDEDAEAATAAFATRQGLGSRVTANVWCKDLKKMDRLSKSDPFVVVKWKTDSDETWREIGRTEIITNDQNPNFTAQFSLTYLFEEVQRVRLEVYDVDTAFKTNDATNLDLGRQDFQGFAETTMAEVLGTSGQTSTLPLVKNTGRAGQAVVSIRMDEVEHQHDLVTLKLRALNVDKKDLTSSDPYLKMARVLETGEQTYIFKTEVQSRTLNPVWREIQGTVQQLANGDLLRPLRVECWDYDRAGGHDFIGGCSASITDMQRWSTASDDASRGPALVNPKKEAKSASYKDSGRLVVDLCTITERPSFLDYIAGGTEISFTMAIDYTASNGNPADPRSLHYVDPAGTVLNDYAKAMSGIGRVLEFYDTDKKFPVIGFGGKLGPDLPANHAFAVNFQEEAPEVEGMAGVLQAYYQSLRRVQLSGPTLFQAIINQAAQIANSTKHRNPVGQKYHVLCVMTDGIINDMDATVSAIVDAADAPLSIVIVGVGQGDFTAMEHLDGDRQRLTSPFTGKVASRDMVQFVPFRDFNGFGSAAQHALAKHVLAEIPGQFISYMQSNGIDPANKRPPGSIITGGGGVSPATDPPMPPQAAGYGAGGGAPNDLPPAYTEY
ncbi:unnamed protein product [Ectocarpus sp. 12 AP-2014]